jgi:DNA-binding CsgD family transcriptional regulator
LIGFADVSLIKGRLSDAALLLAFAERLIGQIGVQLELGDRHDYEQTMTKLAERLSEAEYQAIADRAQRLTLDELFSQTHLFRSVVRSKPTLTAREIDILRCVAAGLTDKHIAANLTISAHTVNAHLRSIYRKLDVNTRTAAVTLAQKYSLL